MSKRIFITIGLSWMLAVSAGSWAMMKYANTPGPMAQTPQQWPTASLIPRGSETATLVMFVHPRCPCSRASLGELALLMAHCQSRVNAHVLFYKPADATNDWAQTDLWRSAAAIPGVTVSADDDGAESHRFQAGTSGQTMLYDRHGQLLFTGGITAARGHAGDNDGRSEIVALVNGQATPQNHTPVYGCSLVTPAVPQAN